MIHKNTPLRWGIFVYMSSNYFGTVENVELMFQKPPTEREKKLIEKQLERLSSILAARYPTLRQRWEESLPDSDLRILVSRMVEAACAKITRASQGNVASETIGPYGYATFESADPGKGLFLKEDIQALEMLLRQTTAKSLKITSDFSVTEAKPMLRPGVPNRGDQEWYGPMYKYWYF